MWLVFGNEAKEMGFLQIFVSQPIESLQDAHSLCLRNLLKALVLTHAIRASRPSKYSLAGDGETYFSPLAHLVLATVYFHVSGLLGRFFGRRGVSLELPLVESPFPADCRKIATVV